MTKEQYAAKLLQQSAEALREEGEFEGHGDYRTHNGYGSLALEIEEFLETWLG